MMGTDHQHLAMWRTFFHGIVVVADDVADHQHLVARWRMIFFHRLVADDGAQRHHTDSDHHHHHHHASVLALLFPDESSWQYWNLLQHCYCCCADHWILVVPVAISSGYCFPFKIRWLGLKGKKSLGLISKNWELHRGLLDIHIVVIKKISLSLIVVHQGLVILYNMLCLHHLFNSSLLQTWHPLLKEFHLHHKQLWKQIAFKQDDILNTQVQDPRCNVLQFVCFLGRNARHSL